MKTKNELYFVFHFFNKNEKRMRALKIQSKNLLIMKMEVNYLNLVFHIEVKAKSNYKIFNLSKTQNGTLGIRILVCMNLLCFYREETAK